MSTGVRGAAERLVKLAGMNYASSVEPNANSIEVTKAGAAVVTFKVIGELPPEHLSTLTPSGYSATAGIRKVGPDSYISYTLRPRHAACKWALMKVALLVGAIAFAASAAYLYAHWGAPVDKAVREYAKQTGVAHDVLTYAAAAVIGTSCCAAIWMLCLGDSRHEKLS